MVEAYPHASLDRPLITGLLLETPYSNIDERLLDQASEGVAKGEERNQDFQLGERDYQFRKERGRAAKSGRNAALTQRENSVRC